MTVIYTHPGQEFRGVSFPREKGRIITITTPKWSMTRLKRTLTPTNTLLTQLLLLVTATGVAATHLHHGDVALRQQKQSHDGLEAEVRVCDVARACLGRACLSVGGCQVLQTTETLVDEAHMDGTQILQHHKTHTHK